MSIEGKVPHFIKRLRDAFVAHAVRVSNDVRISLWAFEPAVDELCLTDRFRPGCEDVEFTSGLRQ